MEAPLVPQIRSVDDTQYYDPYVQGENTLLSESDVELHAELFDTY